MLVYVIQVFRLVIGDFHYYFATAKLTLVNSLTLDNGMLHILSDSNLCAVLS